MKKIITAIGNPILNEKLKIEKNIEVVGNDIQYQEGIFEILEEESNINFLILSEIINGELTVEKLIEKIKLINKNIKIIIILEERKEELENMLITKGIFKILYNNQVEIKDIIQLINKIENKDNENEELKQEINNLKKLIIENQQLNTDKIEKNNFYKNQINNKKEKIKIIKNQKNKLFSKINLFHNKKINEEINKEKIEEKEIISITGPSGVGKSIISVNLAKSMMYKKEKILIIDFDILNSSLHTILGVKKIPLKIDKELNKNNVNNLNMNRANVDKSKFEKMDVNSLDIENMNVDNLNIEKFIIKINKKIDLISAVNLLFNTNNIKEKINIIKIEKIISQLKEKYNTIIIDTSSECFFDFTKIIIKLSNKTIFVTETNILEIKKAKELLNIYINEWKIDKNKFNILFNKYDKDCININLLKELFCEFNIIGTLKYNSKYNRLINKNIKNNFNDKKIRNEYIEINNKLV